MERWGVALGVATDALHAAVATKDLVRIQKAVDSYTAVVDRFAKASRVPGFGNDGTTINNIVDARQQKVVALYDSLPTDTLRRLSAGTITIEQVVGAAVELSA